jgi:hypothetical protein
VPEPGWGRPNTTHCQVVLIHLAGRGRQHSARCLLAPDEGAAEIVEDGVGESGIYREGEQVGWCNMGPRSEITRLAGSRLIRPVENAAVWSIVYVVVRSGHRRQGVTALCSRARLPSPSRTARQRSRHIRLPLRDGWRV